MNTKAFATAFARTMKHEGGFSNDPADPGGVTYMGISREHHPDWPGWALIDAELVRCGVACLGLNSEITEQVRAFYVAEFWTRIQGDFVASVSVDVACELFDTAVNLGRTRAVELLQRALNLLNRNGAAYPEVVEDGVMGTDTRSSLVLYFDKGLDEKVLVKVMNHLQAGHYINLMQRYPSKERFAGWFART